MKPKFNYINADDIDFTLIMRDAFVIYQDQHSDLGAQLADVCLPGATYAEKLTM
jgi:NADH dehydrogenase (ubiquinone) Fe-S protein 1